MTSNPTTYSGTIPYLDGTVTDPDASVKRTEVNLGWAIPGGQLHGREVGAKSFRGVAPVGVVALAELSPVVASPALQCTHKKKQQQKNTMSGKLEGIRATRP